MAFFVLATGYYFCLPATLFTPPYATALHDREGELLSASIASDGQWRFPPATTIPQKFATALVLFEDKRFRHHPGVDFLAIARAVRQNLGAGKVVSGGSTLTMQVVRLSRNRPARTWWNKVWEMVLATRLEWRLGKDAILQLYAAHAPFGGNVVGLSAAGWRYFGHSAEELTWAEAATLAVLPNQPSLIHLSRNRRALLQKRNHLLRKLLAQREIDSLTYDLALAEPLPHQPYALPRLAPHLLQRARQEGLAQQRITSTLHGNLQRQVSQVLADHQPRLAANKIFNAAAVVVEVNSGSVLAYVGNVEETNAQHHNDVDVARAPRSTGSILKPFLYAAMLDEGKSLPHSLVPDIPTHINGFVPKNFSRDYDGAVPASQALIRSLNVPAVHQLQQYRYEKFHSLLQAMGFQSLSKPAHHYGLSLVLGGAESTLFEVTGAYASLARTLNLYFERPGANRYARADVHAPTYLMVSDSLPPGLQATGVISAGAAWLTFEVLKELYRPGEETGWQQFSSAKTIAWKTGTSFGYRDGWAVGVNAHYAVGVWTGNADGEGRPGLTGTEAAAPVLFSIFGLLPGNDWFERPARELMKIVVCSKSGFRAAAWCEGTDSVYAVARGLESKACPYHRLVHLSADQQYRVHADCEHLGNLYPARWFVLPPVQEHFYKLRNHGYRPLPPFRQGCQVASALAAMDLVYPKPNATIFIPRQLTGQASQTIFEAAHRQDNLMIYWHLDGNFIGSTQNSHRLALHPGHGKHTLLLVDEYGETLQTDFWVASGM